MKTENIARAKGTNLGISTKFAIEVCNFIKGKSVSKMQKYLADVLEFKKAIPFKKYNMDLPHQKGKQGPSRYPTNAVKAILEVLNSAVSNAEDKGLDTSSLVIKNAIANKGPTVWRYGRQARRQAKRTHVEITVVESLETRKKPKAAEKKETPKVEEKAKETKKEETPKEEKKVDKPKEEKKAEEKPKEEKKEAPKKEEPKEEKKE